MGCFQNCEYDITPVRKHELEMEYQRGVKSYQIELAKVRQEECKKQRRKVPKAGCYPSGFSAFTSKRVACTISLSELRKDLVIMTAAGDPEPNRSGYFNDAVTCAPEQEMHTNKRRNCRQKITYQDFVRPYSAAEERRQLAKVLCTSTLGKRSSHQLNLTKRVNCG
jgi:hypothetical protein